MGLDLILFAFRDPRDFGNNHAIIDGVGAKILCDRDSGLIGQLNMYGDFYPENEDDPPVVVRPQPLPKGFTAYCDPDFDDDGVVTHDRLGPLQWCKAEEFNKIDLDYVEHGLCRAAVMFMRALPKNYMVIVWRA